MSRMPPKERLPFCRTRVTASVVSWRVWLISARLVEGTRFRHSSLPSWDEAYSVSWLMIL